MSSVPVEKKPIKDLLAEKDAFLTSSEKLYEYFLRHTRAFILVAVVAVLAVVLWAAYGKYEAAAEEEAAAAYEDALDRIAAEPDRAAEALEAVRTDFKGRKAARMAAYTLVSLYSGRNETGRALELAGELMRTLPPAEAPLKPVLLGDLAGLYEAEKKYDEAAAIYETLRALGQPDLRRDSLMALGRVNAARGLTEEAAGNYQAVINEYPNDVKAYIANSLLAALKGEPTAFPAAGD